MVTLPIVSSLTSPVTVKAVFPAPPVKVVPEDLTALSAVMVKVAAVIEAVKLGLVTV